MRKLMQSALTDLEAGRTAGVSEVLTKVKTLNGLDAEELGKIDQLETVLMKSLESEGGLTAIERIADAMERISPPPLAAPDFAEADAFVWHVDPDRVQPVPKVNGIDLPLLIGIDRARDTLLINTRQFAQGNAANNALLWGARGMGKSSLVKAIHGEVVADGLPLKLIEIQREDLPSIGRLLGYLRDSDARFVLFCDDLSFSHDDEHYKSLKAVLDGGVEGRPSNVILYATSNRRHLMPRDMIENERSTSISPSEAVEEKVSLSDRFGLWLGFHPCTQDEYLDMIRGYCSSYGVEIDDETLVAEAIEWQQTRGSRSGRVAWQYFTDLAGRTGLSV
ncbi:MAG: ATP-binding protein [Litoreibacter sp.]|nr:ATP-binding protein [Litoreibacter sp.]